MLPLHNQQHPRCEKEGTMLDRWLRNLHMPSFAWGVGITVIGISTIQIIVAVIEGSAK